MMTTMTIRMMSWVRSELHLLIRVQYCEAMAGPLLAYSAGPQVMSHDVIHAIM